MFGSSLPAVVCRRRMSYFLYLCLFTYSGVKNILCCMFVLIFFVLCTLCCQFIWIVHFCFAPSVFFNVYLILAINDIMCTPMYSIMCF